MSDIDDFAEKLLEEAKGFLEMAKGAKRTEAKDAYLHAALSLGFCAFEAHVNAIADDFFSRKELNPLERSILAERDYKLEDGVFVIQNTLKMYRLQDRIEFMHRRFSGKPLKKTDTWWSEIKKGLTIRNDLAHPKAAHAITDKAVEQALRAIIDTLSVLYRAIFKREYPPKRRGLDSSLVL